MTSRLNLYFNHVASPHWRVPRWRRSPFLPKTFTLFLGPHRPRCSSLPNIHSIHLLGTSSPSHYHPGLGNPTTRFMRILRRTPVYARPRLTKHSRGSTSPGGRPPFHARQTPGHTGSRLLLLLLLPFTNISLQPPATDLHHYLLFTDPHITDLHISLGGQPSF